jgi:hypothetical protein
MKKINKNLKLAEKLSTKSKVQNLIIRSAILGNVDNIFDNIHNILDDYLYRFKGKTKKDIEKFIRIIVNNEIVVEHFIFMLLKNIKKKIK